MEEGEDEVCSWQTEGEIKERNEVVKYGVGQMERIGGMRGEEERGEL